MLSRLLVKNFRCFSEAELYPDAGTTLLVGSNGQGKTSLLEAACVLMRLQSPRSSSRTDWIRFDEKNCLIEGTLHDRRLRFAQSASTRRLAVNEGICTKAGDYLQSTGLVVWMDFSDMLLVRGGAEYRRRFLDFTAAQMFPEYLPSLRNYERLLRSRNYLLKRDAVINWRQADAYATLLEQQAAIIARIRRTIVEGMQTAVQAGHAELSDGNEHPDISYSCGFEEGRLVQQLGESREEESRTRSTAAGTHRDDIIMTINGRAAASFASEGQQRTLSLALKLAQTRTLEAFSGQPPLLLLDDVFGELDKMRRLALLKCLPNNAQKLITTTFLDWIDTIPGNTAVWSVKGGSINKN